LKDEVLFFKLALDFTGTVLAAEDRDVSVSLRRRIKMTGHWKLWVMLAD